VPRGTLRRSLHLLFPAPGSCFSTQTSRSCRFQCRRSQNPAHGLRSCVATGPQGRRPPSPARGPRRCRGGGTTGRHSLPRSPPGTSTSGKAMKFALKPTVLGVASSGQEAARRASAGELLVLEKGKIQPRAAERAPAARQALRGVSQRRDGEGG